MQKTKSLEPPNFNLSVTLIMKKIWLADLKSARLQQLFISSTTFFKFAAKIVAEAKVHSFETISEPNKKPRYCSKLS
jgi:hypothetical protein